MVDRTQTGFTHPAPNLDTIGLGTHQAGKGPFDFLWEIPQLGPLYNNDACFGCHGFNGRGESQIGQDMITPSGLYGSQALIRCSMPTGTPDVPGGQVSVPNFGTQLQDHATVGVPEVNVTLTWDEHTVTYGDGSTEMLREPHVAILQANGTARPDGVLYSYRQAPPIIGLGRSPRAIAANISIPDIVRSFSRSITPGGPIVFRISASSCRHCSATSRALGIVSFILTPVGGFCGGIVRSIAE